MGVMKDLFDRLTSVRGSRGRVRIGNSKGFLCRHLGSAPPGVPQRPRPAVTPHRWCGSKQTAAGAARRLLGLDMRCRTGEGKTSRSVAGAAPQAAMRESP